MKDLSFFISPNKLFEDRLWDQYGLYTWWKSVGRFLENGLWTRDIHVNQAITLEMCNEEV